MVVIGVCVVLVFAGVLMMLRWGALPDRAAAHERREAPNRNAATPSWRYTLGAVAVGFVSGLAAGVLIGGAGGRLAMRLLALTSPDARGQITEADEIVGSINADGTLGLIVFVAGVFGWTSGVLYMILRRLLPCGRARGVAFGALLLIVAGTRVDPLRADNPDFVLLGPAWLAVLAFSAVVLLDGMLVAALAERISVALPWTAAEPATARPHSRVVMIGRVAIGLVTVAALPGFVAAIVDIL